MTETSNSDARTHDDNDGRDGGGKYSQEHGASATSSSSGGSDDVRVLDPGKADQLRNRWNEVQAGFVDEPRESVNGADQLVGEVLDEVSRVFKEQRAELEKAWSGGEGSGEPGTEDLRQALQRYREFFDRLLSL